MEQIIRAVASAAGRAEGEKLNACARFAQA